jgi:hypothetical protein
MEQPRAAAVVETLHGFCGCKPMPGDFPASDTQLALFALQLTITVFFANRSRPESDATSLTLAYFNVALLVNIMLLVGHMEKSCLRLDTSNAVFMLSYHGGYNGSFMVIALIHMVLVKRLEAMGRGKGLKRVLRVEICSILCFTVAFIVFTTIILSPSWSPEFAARIGPYALAIILPIIVSWPFLSAVVVYGFLYFSVRCVKTFYRAWKETELEATEGGPARTQ